MAVYRIRKDSLFLTELPMYGEKRLGVIKENKFLMKKPAGNNVSFGVINFTNFSLGKQNGKQTVYTLGKKHYETTDWLGNVRVTYTDKKSWQQNKFALNVSSSQDYYPFGSVMEGRDLEITNYRFGFQGQEGDDEVFGTNNLWAYKYRLHDARLGRFFSVDPLADKYPYNSVYAFSENRVIDGVELEGLEYLNSDEARIEIVNGEVLMKIENFNFISRKMWENANKNPENWTYTNGQKDIGISRKIGYLKFTTLESTPQLARLNRSANSPENNDANHKIQNPKTKQSHYTQEDKRYKTRSISGGGKFRATAARATLALNIINSAFEYGILGAAMYESYRINEDLKVLNKALQDVLIGIDKGLIPEQYQNIKDLSHIINVVLQGENNSDNKELYEIGMKIYNTISTTNKKEK
ncbi:MAG: hypothetical protein KatS3mg035_2143 [Bacteroidia bacterium]|nr:MAG: hypothetical protein KatS3mg035_2143 [Bacteroidia bacterium]